MAALLGESLHVVRARARRDRPGLRPQHLAAIEACAEMCDAETEGLEAGAAEFTFAPRSPPRGGSYRWEIGTAGSTTMLAMTVLPLAAWADGPVEVVVVGGVYQDFAPSRTAGAPFPTRRRGILPITGGRCPRVWWRGTLGRRRR